MKRLLLSIPLALLCLSVVVAGAMMQFYSNKITLAEKDAAWGIVPNGANGEVIFSYLKEAGIQNGKVSANLVRANAFGLNPKTEYTLIYYGFEEYNDVWNYATCITQGKTSTQGYVKMMTGNFDYSGFLDDEKAQKFWIVKSSDVDCKNHRMIAWNPSEYLFETSTI